MCSVCMLGSCRRRVTSISVFARRNMNHVVSMIASHTIMIVWMAPSFVCAAKGFRELSPSVISVGSNVYEGWYFSGWAWCAEKYGTFRAQGTMVASACVGLKSVLMFSTTVTLLTVPCICVIDGATHLGKVWFMNYRVRKTKSYACTLPMELSTTRWKA